MGTAGLALPTEAGKVPENFGIWFGVC